MPNDHLNIIDEFEKTANQLLKMVSECPESLFNEKPDAKSWSPGQVADHTNKSLSGAVKALRAEGVTAGRDPQQLAEMFQSLFLNFETKYERPDSVKPGDEIDQPELAGHIRSNIEKIKKLAEEEDLSRIAKGFELPQIGEITKLEWLYFAVYHTRRHIRQMEKTLEMVADR